MAVVSLVEIRYRSDHLMQGNHTGSFASTCLYKSCDYAPDDDSDRYGQRKALLERLRATGRDVPSYQTARDAGMVAGRFEPSRRRDNLTFKHHRETAPLPADQADAILDRAEQERLSTREVRALVSQVRSAKALSQAFE